MIFNSFRLNVLVRVLLVCTLALGLAFVLAYRNWFFTPLVIGITLIVVIASLIRYVEKTNKDIAQFLMAVRQGGYTSTFVSGKRGGIFTELSGAFNQVLEEFQRVTIEKESHYQYLKTLNENIGVAIISFLEDGQVEMINEAAKTMLKKPYLNNIEEISHVDHELYETVLRLESGEKEVVKALIQNEVVHLSVHAKAFILKDKNFKVVLLQNINRELEGKEVEAWQKLTSVLTHEIMNSVTPIVSLTEAVNTMIKNGKNEQQHFKEINEDDVEDIYSSLATIENRGRGLLKFVKAYKDFSKVPELRLKQVNLIEMIERIENLLKPDIDLWQIKFEIRSKNRNLTVKIDEELMEQVFINLIKNAIEAVREAQNPSIAIHIERLGVGRVRVRLIDNGPGIDAETLEKIFIPFFTTKKKGTGVGLSLSRKIMRLHNGMIGAQSSVGEGTVFTLEF